MPELQAHFYSAGLRIAARLLTPSDQGASHDALIIVASGDGRGGSDTETWGVVGRRLTLQGFNVLFFDYAGCGKSDGEYSNLCLSIGIGNLIDAVKFAKTELFGGSFPFGCIGSSFGGPIAICVQKSLRCFDAISLKSPAIFLCEAYEHEHTETQLVDWKNTGVSGVSGLKFNAYRDSLTFNPYAAFSELDVPIQIVHGDADEIVPLRQSLRARLVADRVVELLVLPGVSHKYQEQGALQELAFAQSLFFRRNLP